MDLITQLRQRVFDFQNLGIWVLGSAVAGYMGPFGTYLMFDTVERTVFWGCIVGWGLLIIAVSMCIADTYMPYLTYKQEELGRLVIMPPIVVLPMYPVVEAYIAPLPIPVGPWEAVLACYLLGGIITCARFAIATDGNEPIEEAELEPAARLAKRLPEGTAGPILRLSGKNRFVEVVTPCGRHDVRMRLADAVEEMGGVEGFFTHRSHWVAREAIQNVERKGGKHYVVSADEKRIPVSRGKLPELDQAGLI